MKLDYIWLVAVLMFLSLISIVAGVIGDRDDLLLTSAISHAQEGGLLSRGALPPLLEKEG